MNLDDIATKYAVEALNESDIEASWLGLLISKIKLASLESWKEGMTDAAAIVHSVNDEAVELSSASIIKVPEFAAHRDNIRLSTKNSRTK